MSISGVLQAYNHEGHDRKFYGLKINSHIYIMFELV